MVVMRILFRSIVVMSIFGLSLGGLSFSQGLDNVKSPLVDEGHAGGATKIGVAGAEGDDNDTGGKGDAILNVVKSAINYVLGILGLISLMLVLYGGFLMMTSMGEDEKYSKGWKIIKYALIGLVVIGLSWLIITLVFWLINKAAVGAEATGE